MTKKKTAKKVTKSAASKARGGKPKSPSKAPPKVKAKKGKAPARRTSGVRSPVSDAGRRESLAAAKVAMAAAMEKKAELPVLIDVCGLASYADYIGIVSGRSDRQVDAIAEHVCQTMSALGHRSLGREGMRNGRWVLLDFGDVVIHVFYHPLRETFDIESLWIDAPRVKLPADKSAGERA